MQSYEKKWPVQSISEWKYSSKTWEDTPFKEGCCCLLIKETQLLILETTDTVTTVVESVCLIGTAGEVKATYLNDLIGVQILKNQGNLARFFKIRLANSLEKEALDNCIEVVNELKRFIAVTDNPKHKGKKSQVIVAKPLQQVLKTILRSNPEKVFKNTELVLQNDSIEETVRECLLDPGFLALELKTEEILKKVRK